MKVGWGKAVPIPPQPIYGKIYLTCGKKKKEKLTYFTVHPPDMSNPATSAVKLPFGARPSSKPIEVKSGTTKILVIIS